MAALIARLTVAMRARTSWRRSPSTRADTPRRARAGQFAGAGAAPHLSTALASPAISPSTPRHLTHNAPSGARNVNSPNGSSLVGVTDRAGASLRLSRHWLEAKGT